ncbi:ubiquitin-conjugating enzyme E2 Q1-like [Ptychodera flava]|uniref:ubiquitin-conjugating enzyme E2 Q1-like n=1 Tax=Ptychodera flava TaxID=63121 RepID=UPI003969D7FF
MNFSDQKTIAEEWLATGKTPFELVLVEDSERRLVFSSGDVSFYVVCPEVGQSNFHVWSDNEVCLAYLTEVQDYVTSCRDKTLQEVLAITAKSLRPVLAQPLSDSDGDEGMGDEDDDEEDDEDMDADDDDYYAMDDEDAAADTSIPKEESEGDLVSADDFFTGDGSAVAVHRLLADLKLLKKSEGKFGVEGNPKGDNLFIWDVKLKDFDPKSKLGKDLKTYATKYKRDEVITLEMKFPKDYPMSPPFVRVLRPRFKFLTGHVTVGGSICMQLLTKSGWRPANDIESILIQIRSEIMSDPNAQLDYEADREYDEHAAKQAFERMVMRYGWNK